MLAHLLIPIESMQLRRHDWRIWRRGVASKPAIREKITVSLPSGLVRCADEKAAREGTSRSEAIAKTLAAWKEHEERELAADGYRSYAQECKEFATSSIHVVSEALDDTG